MSGTNPGVHASATSIAGAIGRTPVDAHPRRRAADRGVSTLHDSDDALPPPHAEVLRRGGLFRRSLVGADLVSAVVALAAAALVSEASLRLASLAAAPLVILAAKLSGLYDRDEVVLRKSTLDEAPAVFRVAGLSAVLLWLAQGEVSNGVLGRLTILTLWGTLFALMVTGRMLARSVALRATEPERCVLVGEIEGEDRLAAKLGRSGARLVASLPITERRRRNGSELHPEPWIALAEVVASRRAHRVIVAPGPHADAEAALNVVTHAKAIGVHVTIMPRLFEVVGSSVEFDEVEGMTMLGVRRFGLTRSSRIVKRATDLAGSLGALILVGPLMVLAAVLIRLESPGPVLFRQTRVGRDGMRFTMLKFRSMYDGADQEREEIARLNQAGDGMFKSADDPRITRVGRFLRRLSLDELPQLLNVVRGEMSLVGPRPLIVEEDRRVQGWHRRRLQLTPGMTGPWQVLGTSETRVPLREMVIIDYLYAANWSLWADVKVLLRTIGHVARARGV